MSQHISWGVGLCLCVGTSCYTIEEVGPGTPDPGPGGQSSVRDEDGDGFPDAFTGDPEIVRPDACDDGDHPCTETDLDGDGFADPDDVDDDGDRILEAPPPADLVEAVGPIAARLCAQAEGCCAGGWSDAARAECVLRATGDLTVTFAQPWHSGRIELRPEGLDACLASLETECEDIGWLFLAEIECRDYFVGQRDERQLCWVANECAAGLFCAVGGGSLDCTSGAYCIVDYEFSGRCEPQSGPGGPCTGEDERSCEPGLYCAQGACLELAGLDEPCPGEGTSPACRDDLFCGRDLTCQPKRADGEHCLDVYECLGTCDAVAEQCVSRTYSPIETTCR